MCVCVFVSISCSCGFIRFLLCLLLWHFLSIAWLSSAYRKTSFICAFCLPRAAPCLPFAPPSPVTYPLQPCDGIPSKFGATLSNYLYGIHNFCWWSFSPKPLSLAYDGRVICVNKCLWNWILRMAQGGRVGVGWGRYARRTALQVAFALSLLGLGDISLALALKLSA